MLAGCSHSLVTGTKPLTYLTSLSPFLFFLQVNLPGTHNLHYLRATREVKDIREDDDIEDPWSAGSLAM